MDLLFVAGTVLWIVALSIMVSASHTAWRRIRPEARLPMAPSGKGGWRLGRGPALCLIPAIALLASFALVFAYRGAQGPQAVILFGARATLAALFAFVHLRWLTGALATLQAEGQLKP
jgi:hypothetical protein